MDHSTQGLVDVREKICDAIKDTNYQLEHLNENIENVTSCHKDRASLNVVASVYEN